jgi:hypothetical protein
MRKYHYYFIAGIILLLIGGAISSISEDETYRRGATYNDTRIYFDDTRVIHPYETWGFLFNLMGFGFLIGSIVLLNKFIKSQDKKAYIQTCTKCARQSEIESPYCPYCGEKREDRS